MSEEDTQNLILSRLDRIEQRLDKYDAYESRFDRIDAWFDQVTLQFEHLDSVLKEVLAVVQQIDNRHAKMERQFATVVKELFEHKTEITHLANRLDALEEPRS